LDYADDFLFDVKCVDEDLHKRFTGSSNILILENFKKLYDLSKNITDTAVFLKDYKNIRYAEFMPFHATASHKYDGMNLKNSFAGHKSINADSDLINRFKDIFREYDINIK